MRITVAMAVACLSVGLSIADDAHAAIKKDTTIPAQGLGSALQQLAKDRDVQLVYRSEIVGDKRTSGAVGELTFDEALTKLLDGTGLTYQYIDDRAITLVPFDSQSLDGFNRRRLESAEPRASASGVWERFRLAQADDRAAPSSSSAVPSSSRSESRAELEEVIVTAQKREQAIIDVPMSVVAISGEELNRRGISNTVDIALSVPGIAVQDRGGGGDSRYIFMRGLGNTRGSQPLVGVYLDEQDVTSAQVAALDLRAYDLERLEVLRGPQGTLYGSGAMGGVLRYITKKPDLSSASGDVYVTASQTDGGDPSQTVGGSVNLPVVQDVLGFRVSGFYEDSGGWIDQPALAKSNINDERLYGVRVKGLWEPTEALEIASTAMIHRNDAGAPNTGEDDNGNFTQSLSRQTTPSGSNDYETYSLTAKYNASAFQVLSTTGYFALDWSIRELGYVIPLTPPPAAPVGALVPTTDGSVKAFTQELRIASANSDGFVWTLGASYRDAESATNGIFLLGLTDPPISSPVLTSAKSESWAVFGEASSNLGDRLTLGLGLRYYQDTQTNVVTSQSGVFDQLSPRFFARFVVTDTVNLYANIAKGFRSGGFNTAFAISKGAPPEFQSDAIWSYELGAKGGLLDGRLSFDLAGFYSEYTDVQDTGFVVINDQLVSLVGNLGEAVIKGVDWDFTLRATNHLSFGTGGEYLDGEYTKIKAVRASQAVGDPLKQIPKYHAAVWSMYERPNWLGGDSGYLRVEYNRQGEAEYRNRSFGPLYYSRSDKIDMLNAAVGWEKGRWAISASARNILNDRGYIDGESLEHLAARSRPRTYELNVRVAF